MGTSGGAAGLVLRYNFQKIRLFDRKHMPIDPLLGLKSLRGLQRCFCETPGGGLVLVMKLQIECV